MEQTFLVEGEKSVLELLRSDYEIIEIIASPSFTGSYLNALHGISVTETEEDQISTISSLATNKAAVALVKMKQNELPHPEKGIYLALDDINDPGNLGTIIRIADWYGISGIIASKNTTDIYSPKVISATKGSFTRVPVVYCDLAEFLSKGALPVFAADIHGKSIHEMEFPSDMVLLLGNESHGISSGLLPFITGRITIPRYGGAESLNVGMAAAVICDRLRN